MTRYAYMLPAHERAGSIPGGGAALIPAILDHPTTALPDVAPVWARYRPDLRHFIVDWRLLRDLRALGIEPILYAETGPMQPDAILAGQHDDAFRLMAARARGAGIRIFHESNGKARRTDGSPLFPWQPWPITQIIDVQRRVGDLVIEEGSAGIHYSPAHRGRANDDMLDRYPGDDVVAGVGFTEFRRGASEPLPSKRWASAIARLATTGLPVSVYETGVLADLGQRAAFIRDLGNVAGLDLVAVFDFLIAGPGLPVVDDWRWTDPRMATAWDRLPRG